MVKVFINPGHSENAKPDPGAVGNGYKEAIIAREICDNLYTILKAKGIEVELYQQKNEKNENLTANQQLNRVPNKANESKADLFISVHLNSGVSTAHGTETLYMRNSTNGKKIAELINSELIKPFSNYSLYDRGAKIDTRELLVLKATSMPAALVEVGFISNSEEAKYIASHTFDMAERIATAICKYFNLSLPKTKENKFRIEQNSDNLYDCYLNDVLKLKSNKLQSVLNWISKNYAE